MVYLNIILFWIGFCAVASLLVWVLMAAAKALFFPKLDYEGVIILGFGFGSFFYAIFYILAVLGGTPQNAYELAFLERAEKVCQTTVDYNFRFEPRIFALPGEMIGRQVLSRAC